MRGKLLQAVLLSLFLTQTAVIFPQQSNSLYIPKNIRKAYKAETRSLDGKPGPKYWQNHADYRIQVRLIPKTHMVVGEESIKYYNESPDSLDRLVLRLYQNFLKKGNSRDFPADPNDLHNGVKIYKLSINGKKIPINGNKAVVCKGTNLIIHLTKKIPPHSTVNLSVKWQFPLPLHSAGRYGAADSTAFFVAYWYPQIAVYDDIDGWDMFNFHGIQEFYNDFNNFDVNITVPRGFVVWATGLLQNAEETLNPVCLSRYRKATTYTSLIHVITAEDLQLNRTTVNQPQITWHFKAQQVTDFTFATSNRYVWDMIALPAPHLTEGRILISAAYKPGAKFLPGVANLQKQTIQYFSEEMPGVPFPFPSYTLFQYKGGNEFPMMNSQGVLDNIFMHVFVATHELAHSYFPLLVGVNERKYAWMDEGWAMFLPLELQNSILQTDVLSAMMPRFYYPFVGGEFDIPPMVPSIVFGTDCFNEYRYSSYSRSSSAYKRLMELVGRKRFLTALQKYIHRWRGKHPTPYDFFFSFNDILGEDLSWFWRPWFFEFAAPDLSLDSMQTRENKVFVNVVNKGGLPMPVRLTITYADGTHQTIEKSARVWRNGNRSIEIKFVRKKAIRKIEIGDSRIPDINKKDNYYDFTK